MPNIELDPILHDYKVDGVKVPGVTKILGDLGLIDFSMVPEDLLRRANAYGNAVHKTTEYDDKKVLKTYDKKVENDLLAWRKFKIDYQVEFIPGGIERRIHSKRWGFCGTLDRIGFATIKKVRKLAIMDEKTSAQFYEAVRLQTAGYKIGYEEETHQKVQTRLVVRLNGDGNYKVDECNDPNDEHAFIGAVQLWKWRNLHSK